MHRFGTVLDALFSENLFKAYLLTECACLKTELEPQGGERMSAKLDDKYK